MFLIHFYSHVKNRSTKMVALYFICAKPFYFLRSFRCMGSKDPFVCKIAENSFVQSSF